MALIDTYLNLSLEAFSTYKQTAPKDRAVFLEEMATQIDATRDQLIPTASKESHLPEGRITGELGRTLGQIRLFAQLVKEGSWVEANIDHADPNRSPLPKPDIRRMLRPLGPVLVFGASNFPLAFSTAGGDTVSALAAGCPVIYKAHPAHPETSRIVSEAIKVAIRKSNLPKGVFQHVEGGVQIGQELANHPNIQAIAFTGSFRGGKALFDTATQRDTPIPVYAEMGSVNPIFAFENKLSNDLKKLAAAYAGSLTLGVGQFCTNPGLIFIPEKFSQAFGEAVLNHLKEVSAAPMLHEGIGKAYYEMLKPLEDASEIQWVKKADAEDIKLGSPAFVKINGSDWLKDEAFQEEIFGPYGMMVSYHDQEELEKLIHALKGQLTCTVWAEEHELGSAKHLIREIEEKCGRLLFKGVPTGVEVGFAMQHGGPFPSTTDSRSTSVGVHAIKRFVRPVAFQDMPGTLLPAELADENPLGIWRTVDGKWQK
jgi:2,5-dioxopentanoate dehydrogenase